MPQSTKIGKTLIFFFEFSLKASLTDAWVIFAEKTNFKER